MKTTINIIAAILFIIQAHAQNYFFDFNTSGRRVCLVSSEVDVAKEHVKIFFLDSSANTTEPLIVNRRKLGTSSWSNVKNLPPGTGHWIDTNVNKGEIWEYQIKRQNTWTYNGTSYDATGYTLGALLNDNSNYKGQMILLVSNDIPTNLPSKYARLKHELTCDGWYVNELIVQRAANWDSGNSVALIKSQIKNIYNSAPPNDKPKSLFILGHVPMPRCGSTNVIAPDEHEENAGARGCDGYYADIDGVYTDTATFNPGGLATTLAINLPNDYKWDQDFFPSDIEMDFGRVDFADLTDINTNEMTLIENYLDRLSNYKNVSSGYDMGEKSAFSYGYDNSNDGSYRSLFNISKPQNVIQKNNNSIHNLWVKNNGPFKVYMQNLSVPSMSDWQAYGMDATVYSSDQSYWGFGDVPQANSVYSRIRSILGVNSKCLIALWTTTGINIFHQACNGQSIGQSMKAIMNHNATNQYLQKPPQQYDTEDWWNRTHFELWGDPTINLYQVKPISNLSLQNINNTAVLRWTASPDHNIVGYNIYTSKSKLGIFQKINTSIVNDTTYQIPNFVDTNWYMVRAIKAAESGCGKFLHPSLGVMIQKALAVNLDYDDLDEKISIFPNPTYSFVHIRSQELIQEIKVFNSLGQLVGSQKDFDHESKINLVNLENGIYNLIISLEDGRRFMKQVIKASK